MSRTKSFLLLFAFIAASVGAKAQTVIDQGTCGANLTWVLTSDSVLTISGSGGMMNFNSTDNYAPWYAYRDTIATVIISDSVTTIGWFAFYYCSNLSAVTIPDGVTSIGGYAFWHCDSLSTITLPNSVTSIGNCAFEYCYSLSSINIPNGVTSIEGYTFHDCRSLTSIIIPNSVTKIGYSAFQNCTSLTSFIIPDGITKIENYTFDNCNKLSSITIGNNVDTIEYMAFANCVNLMSITVLSTTPPDLEGTAFNGVPKTIPVYIPCQSYDDYTLASGWSDFTNFACKQIFGTILRPNQTPLTSGVAYLYLVKSNGQYNLSDTVSVASDGSYLFTNVADGNYIVKIIPDISADGLPTYYGNTQYWDSAIIINILNNLSVDTVDITLLPQPAPLTGNSFISGYVGKENDGSQGIKPKGVDRPVVDESVSLQRIQSGSWITIAQTRTDINGYFDFEDVPAGTYRFVVDVPGMEMDNPQNSELSERDSIEVELILKVKEVSIKQLQGTSYKLQVYPNPTTGELRVTSDELQVSEIQIYSVTGQLLYQINKSTNKQINNEISIDVSHLEKGMYFIKINEKSVKFVKR